MRRRSRPGAVSRPWSARSSKYLLKYGHCTFDFKEGARWCPCNVAEVIFSELSDDQIVFRNPVYAKIMAVYREQWEQLGTGVEVPAHLFLNHIDPEVCNRAVDLLTADDNYVPSELWKRKEVHVESDAEMLAVGVPKAVTLYKSKVIEWLIKELQTRLAVEGLSEEEESDLVQRLNNYNRVKVAIARKTSASDPVIPMGVVRKRGGSRVVHASLRVPCAKQKINRKMCKNISKIKRISYLDRFPPRE